MSSKISDANIENLENNVESEDPDFVLIREYNNGNESAFEKLLMLHKEKVRNLIFLTLNDSEFVDDIFQDVFISVYKKLDEFRFESKFTTWLYRITVNKCRDYLRKKRVRRRMMIHYDHHCNVKIHRIK